MTAEIRGLVRWHDARIIGCGIFYNRLVYLSSDRTRIVLFASTGRVVNFTIRLRLKKVIPSRRYLLQWVQKVIFKNGLVFEIHGLSGRGVMRGSQAMINRK